MEKISKFVECLLPITLCNLKCHYCYVIQRHNRTMKKVSFEYSIDIIVKALTKERFGGIVYFSICGAGETMLCKELPDLVKGLLSNGHYINITTNGTCAFQLRKLLEGINSEDLKRLHFSFSYHYLELKRLKLNDLFFENVKLVRSYGCSFLIQLNLCDEYILKKDDIINEVKQHVGALPQLAATRKEINLHTDIELYTHLSTSEYVNAGEVFKSPLFEFTMKNFNKRRKEFCYAGAWSYVLNLGTGVLQACYGSKQKMNIFQNIDKKINLVAVGHHCPSPWCMNSSHFLAWGVIPSLDTPSYAELRNRQTNDGEWYTSTIKEAFSHKLGEKNLQYGFLKRCQSEFVWMKNVIIFGLYNICPNFIKNWWHKIK